MDTMTAAEAKQKFGQLIDQVKSGPVEITRHGRAVSVVLSKEDYDLDQYYRKKWLAEKLARAQQDGKDGRLHDIQDVRDSMMSLIDNLYRYKD